MLKLLTRNRWMALLLGVGLIILLGAALSQFGRTLPDRPEFHGTGRLALEGATLPEIRQLFDPPSILSHTNLISPSNLFSTAFFEPPPPAPKPPPPAPPTTKTIEITYNGFYQVAEGQKHGFFQVGTQHMVIALGKKVAGDLTVTDLSIPSATVTNAAGVTNILGFKTKKPVEIPVQ